MQQLRRILSKSSTTWTNSSHSVEAWLLQSQSIKRGWILCCCEWVVDSVKMGQEDEFPADHRYLFTKNCTFYSCSRIHALSGKTVLLEASGKAFIHCVPNRRHFASPTKLFYWWIFAIKIPPPSPPLDRYSCEAGPRCGDYWPRICKRGKPRRDKANTPQGVF